MRLCFLLKSLFVSLRNDLSQNLEEISDKRENGKDAPRMMYCDVFHTNISL